MQLILSNNISAYFFLWESLQVDQLLILTKRTHVHSVGKIGRHRDCLGAPGLHARTTHCRQHAHKHFLFICTSSSANIDTQRDLRVRSERRFHATLTYVPYAPRMRVPTRYAFAKRNYNYLPTLEWLSLPAR